MTFVPPGYSPTAWQNGRNNGTPISMDNLNKIEQGLATMYQAFATFVNTVVPAEIAAAVAAASIASPATFSDVGLDTDGVPYFGVSLNAAALTLDTDGVPYFTAGATNGTQMLSADIDNVPYFTVLS